MSSRTLPIRMRHFFLGAALLPFLFPLAYADQGAGETRVSATRQIATGGRDGQAGERTEHRFPALVTSGQRDTTGASKPAGGSDAARTEASGVDFWFYDVDVILFNDDDGDGYYHGIDLLFDADTYYDVADVYAVLYLSFEGGPWNEYAATDTFTIYGATSDDEFNVVSELLEGYPRGNYDILIELYDTFDGSFVASIGPEDSAELSYLPLEDYERDAPYVEEVVVVEHGGGNGFLLGGLVLLALARRVFTRRAAPRGAARGA